MWHIDAEIISLVFLLVIMADVLKNVTVKKQRDKIFALLCGTTAAAIISNIITSLALTYSADSSYLLKEISLIAYFALTPLLALLWHLYAISALSKRSVFQLRAMVFTAIPYMIFLVLVLTNPWTELIFSITAAGDYSRGILFYSNYVIFYGYGIAATVLACTRFKKAERTTCIVLMTFPIITSLGIFLQELLHGFLVTGAAYTLVLLISYMFLQNRKASRDALTGLYNRASFISRLARAAHGNDEGYVLSIALDDFKLFNQTFGQQNGDLLLVKFAEYIVGLAPCKTAYRYGGDIFAVVCSKLSEADALHLAELIKHRLSEPFCVEDTSYSISACIGVVKFGGGAEGDYSLLTALDFAIYQAKLCGKGQISFFNKELVQKLKRSHDIADALTAGLRDGSFEVFLQPIFSEREGRFAYAESLLRLNDRNLGSIPPSEFIRIAEKSGQIVELTYFVLEQSCKFIRDYGDKICGTMGIAVNFSVVSFMQSDLVARVKSIITSYGVPPELIKIEITESVIAESFEQIGVAMRELHDFGIRFALDDYGQGYSNISYLINLPFTFVKLDKCIIDTVEAKSSIVGALISMFHSQGKTIVAEGVERKEQADILEGLGCDALQGFYFARPMPIDAAARLLH